MIMVGWFLKATDISFRKDKGELATNPQLVARTLQIAKELGKEPATPDEA
jgi:uncharacterized protein (DUF849 family)